jgi:hypothetical protein
MKEKELISKPTATQPLRFAPIIRVSTEGQAEKGRSLKTQKEQIINYVERLGGVIPEYCWKFVGQEHATPEYERKLLDNMLVASGKNLFDCTICCDPSRWSRDNLRNETGLDTLKHNGIRFFVGTKEFDLIHEQDRMYLAQAAVMNQYTALLMARKSIENRISRAKNDNRPTAGKLPYGRTWDKTKKTWGDNDPDKQAKIERAAKRYLAGEGLPKIAKDLGMNAANLWKVLTRRSGDKWTVEYHNNRLNIHEPAEMTIPRLLPQETIDLILERARANKTYTHGMLKHQYLLARMIFCNHCGYTMFGQKNHSGKRYYRHARQDRRKNSCPSHRMYVPAEDIERAVLIQLFNMFGDRERIEKAVLRAIPDADKAEELQSEKETLLAELRKIELRYNNIVDAIGEGTISKERAKAATQKLDEREKSISERLTLVNTQLETIPTKKQIVEAAKIARRNIMRLDAAMSKSFKAFSKMSYEAKRKLMEYAFQGLNTEGKRRGIYISKTGNPKKPFTYVIDGVLSMKGRLPMEKEEAQELCNIDTDYSDSNPLDIPVEGSLTKYSLYLQEQALL